MRILITLLTISFLTLSCNSEEEKKEVFNSYKDSTREKEVRHRKFDKGVHRNSTKYRKGIDSKPGESNIDTDKRIDDVNSPNYIRNQPDHYKTD